jgi:hypothetical protein
MSGGEGCVCVCVCGGEGSGHNVLLEERKDPAELLIVTIRFDEVKYATCTKVLGIFFLSC